MRRSYTVHEIDALRQACEQRWLFGSNRIGEGTQMSRAYRSDEKDKGVEERVRTYMIAGITADDLWNADNPRSEPIAAKERSQNGNE